MKRFIAFFVIAMQLVVFTCTSTVFGTEVSKYDLYYSQYVDSKEPLADIQEKDFVTNRNKAFASHPLLTDIPDKNRVDYFDIPYGSDPLQKLDIHHLKGYKKRPVIVFIHGGGWVSCDKNYTRFVGPTWISSGYTVVSINYRLAVADSTDPSKRNAHPAQIEDCAMALKWVIDNIDKYGGDCNNIAITGHSAGGHLAALLVTDTKWHKAFNIDMGKVKCWIPMSGIYDFNLKETYYHSFMDGFNNALLDTPDKKDDASPVTHITGNEPPVLIVHGGDDWLVPKTNATEFYGKLKEKGVVCELAMVKGYWHSNTLVNFGEPSHKPTKIISKFLAKYLPTDKNNIKTYEKDKAE